MEGAINVPSPERLCLGGVPCPTHSPDPGWDRALPQGFPTQQQTLPEYSQLPGAGRTKPDPAHSVHTQTAQGLCRTIAMHKVISTEPRRPAPSRCNGGTWPWLPRCSRRRGAAGYLPARPCLWDFFVPRAFSQPFLPSTCWSLPTPYSGGGGCVGTLLCPPARASPAWLLHPFWLLLLPRARELWSTSAPPLPRGFLATWSLMASAPVP